ncbi:MAG: uroporphyrinogen decarboxylase family protein [Dehalococcoidales bacterium]
MNRGTKATQTGTKEKPWQSLTSDEKMERRLTAWLSPPGIDFISSQAEADYKSRVTRISDAVRLRKPDRVPVIPRIYSFTAAYCGYSEKDMWYDVDKAIDAATRCTLELQFDVMIPASIPMGRANEILEEKQRKWAGYGLPDDAGVQFIEDEYMKADEYDAFILDESDFRWRTYLPRVWGIAGPFAKLSPLSTPGVASFGLPDVQEAFQKLMKAGEEIQRWEGKIAAANRKLIEAGFPDLRMASGLGGAPFDRLGDNLRGQRGIVMDMYRQPDKLLEALDVMTRKKVLQIHESSDKVKLGTCPIVGQPLHKGADSFMSDEQFRTFYWPQLREINMALIEEGFIPQFRAQGGYNSRLEDIRDLPKGKVIWLFDMTDMQRAKEVLGDIACIQGNVPLSLINTGTPEETAAYSRHLIDTVGKNGGFMLDAGGGIDNKGKVENVRAMIQTAKEYGVY